MLSASVAAAARRAAGATPTRLTAPAGRRAVGARPPPPPPPAANAGTAVDPPRPGHVYVERSPRVEATYTSRPALLYSYATAMVVGSPLWLYLTA
ncbi:hypothetical protein BU14_0202s0010 [Porphyra umbilicalis]|uniref:Uncharacterized protein n=1 Tax=Porphyra umbilicalis TaxID=2786 RepID=A0A1X6P6G3_PORUM|nr:hypothetical protein BU14_0202s0010 [Porphyra umbilicalis]|eukprot:OSX76223.1 hypothetical protein BU14_0202s0010 [Porphyra umbilicalis]